MTEQESPQIRWERISALVAAVLVCLAAPSLTVLVFDVEGDNAARRIPLVGLAIGAVVGVAIPFLYWAPYRALGLASYAALAWLAASVYGVASGHWIGWAHGLAIGVCSGAIARARDNVEPALETYRLAAAIMLGAAAAWIFITVGRPFVPAGYFVLAISFMLTAWVWLRLFRPTFEITLEPVVWLLYRISGRGPGLKSFPRTGSCIVIANHACWLDPLFLAKVLPRPVTPMMTSRFYNLPVMHRLMVAFGVIRVTEKAIKKDVPEIREAVEALDRGECLVIFPEGYLRRTEDQPLRRFGQGIWQILQARPNIPVFACWIEGGWGSYTSYLNGLPTRNKKLDFRRPLAVAVSDAASVPKDLLSDQLRTRYYLMNLVGAAREHLGLAALPPFELSVKERTTDDEEPLPK